MVEGSGLKTHGVRQRPAEVQRADGQQPRKLLAAKARHGMRLVGHATAQHFAQRLSNAIAHDLATGVIDQFKTIYVEHDQAMCATRRRRLRRHGRRFLVEPFAVQNPRKGLQQGFVLGTDQIPMPTLNFPAAEDDRMFKFLRRTPHTNRVGQCSGDHGRHGRRHALHTSTRR